MWDNGTESRGESSKLNDPAIAIKTEILDTSTDDERSHHPSVAQAEMLVEFLEQHPQMAKGYAKTMAGREQTRRLWEKITDRLNSVGTANKSARQWNKYWCDKKGSIKKKAAMRSAYQQRSDGGNAPEDIAMLTELEERILVLIDESTAKKPREAQPSLLIEKDDKCDSITVPVSEMVTLTAPPGMSQQPSPSSEEYRTEEFYAVDMKVEHLNENEDLTNSANEEDELLVPRPIQPLVTASESRVNSTESHIGALPSIQPPSRRVTSKRRFLARGPRVAGTTLRYPTQALPPSQHHRRKFSNTIDRFLRVEEQQLELQRSNFKLMEKLLERSAERERLLAESLTALAERDRLTTEALREALQASAERMQERDRITAEALRDGFKVLAEALQRR